MYEMALLERDDLVEQQKADVISKSLVIDVLSNEQQLALVLSNVSQYLAGEVSFVKARINDVERPADLERLDAIRKSIAKWRVDSGKNYTAMKKANRDLIAKADDGFELVVSAQKNAESEIEQALSAKKQEFEQERLRKKAISEAIAKLRSHAIDPLLPATDIETAIDDFVIAFGDSDYQESQADAESIFEIKKSQFDEILAAAKLREENEAAVKLENARNQQRSNIGITFPIAEISGYAARSAVDIQARIDWTAKVDMTAFELVLSEADAQKQACLNMLAAFLPMAVAREAKEVADKAEAERLEREKQAAINAENERLAQIERDRIATKQAENEQSQPAMSSENSSELIESVKEAGQIQRGEIDSTPDYQACKSFIENEVAKTIGEPCFESFEASEPVADDEKSIFISKDVAECLSEGYNHDDGYEFVSEDKGEAGRWSVTNVVYFTKNGQCYYFYYTVGLTEMQCPDRLNFVNGMVEAFKTAPIEPVVTIPVSHLINLIFAAEQGLKHCGLDDDENTVNAIEFAKSLI